MKNQANLSRNVLLLLSFFFIFSSSPSVLFATDEINILNLEATEKINGTLIEIFLAQPLRYEIFADQNQGLNVNFYQGTLDTAFFNEKKMPEDLIWIKAYQFENSAQLSFKPKEPFVNFTHNLKTDPYRIQISLIQPPSPSDMAESSLTHKSIPQKESLNNPIDLIVIDPGHGGEDSGAEGADLFISIHTNASRKRSAQGCETFFLSSAKNDEARAVAALENSSIRFEHTENSSKNPDDLNFILMDLVQSEFLSESSDLAVMIQNQLKSKLSIPSRGINQAGFVVLNQAYMPAVLIETAFISNKKEESLLKTSSFRQQIAQAVCQSIKEFKKKYETMK